MSKIEFNGNPINIFHKYAREQEIQNIEKKLKWYQRRKGINIVATASTAALITITSWIGWFVDNLDKDFDVFPVVYPFLGLAILCAVGVVCMFLFMIWYGVRNCVGTLLDVPQKIINKGNGEW